MTKAFFKLRESCPQVSQDASGAAGCHHRLGRKGMMSSENVGIGSWGRKINVSWCG